jgi:cell filamentation protein
VTRNVGRYAAHGPEAEFEPGSRNRVLRNLLGIRSVREMDREEALALSRAQDNFNRTYSADHRFTGGDICEFHRTWLGEIYEWAGNYRQVNVSKGRFTFAAASQIPRLMQNFEGDVLRRRTPCNSMSGDEVISALAETHVELMLIHPFREGNGRVGRILATLMALQAGLPLLNYNSIRGTRKQQYFAAVRAGLDRDYKLMKSIFSDVIARSRPPS